MRTRYFVATLFAIISCLLSACSLTSKNPEAVYYDFAQACDSGDIATAESLATANALQQYKTLGICILMPNGLDKKLGTSVFQFIDEEPQIEIRGNTAYLTWRTDSGREVQMIMFKTNGRWKIENTMIY